MSEWVYQNEPGHERFDEEANRLNLGYSNIVRLNNIRYAMREAIKMPCAPFRDVILRSFYIKSEIILDELHGWLQEA
jgi:hypothetical protein